MVTQSTLSLEMLRTIAVAALIQKDETTQLKQFYALQDTQARNFNFDVLDEDTKRLQSQIAPLITLVHDMEHIVTEEVEVRGDTRFTASIKMGHDVQFQGEDLGKIVWDYEHQHRLVVLDGHRIKNTTEIYIQINSVEVRINCIFAWVRPKHEDVLTIINNPNRKRTNFPRDVIYYVRCGALDRCLFTDDYRSVESLLKCAFACGLSDGAMLIE